MAVPYTFKNAVGSIPLSELDDNFNSITTGLAAATGATTVGFNPTGTISSNTVQSAIAELDTEKAVKGANSDITSLNALSSINGGQLAGLRNRIINGSALITQRGVVTLGSTAVYTTDRVLMSVLGGTGITATGSSSALSAGSSGLGHYITGSFTTGQPLFAQRIESANCFDLNSKTITVSGRFFQNSGASQLIQVRVSKPTTTKDTFSAITILQTSASITIPNGTTASTAFSATFTLGAADASLGLMVEVYIATIITQSVAANFALSDWQLEIGSVATPFEQRPIGMELALCQRYYEKIGDGISGAIDLAGYSPGSTEIASSIYYKVTKRTAPLISSVGTWTVTNCGQPNFNGDANSCYISTIVTAAGTGKVNSSTSAYLTVSSEL